MVKLEKMRSFMEKVYDCLNEEAVYLSNKLFLEFIDKDELKANDFVNELKIVEKELAKDVIFFIESDPAVDSKEEVVLTYPGYKAIVYYRVGHVLRKLGYDLISRIVTEIAHSETGIDIHPGATIDAPFFIDHGTGVVIGETSLIGKNVKIYQGVTLGALSLRKGKSLKGIKRHPTIGDNVTIYSGASILGDVDIGNDVTIGSNVFLTEDVKPGLTISIGKPILVLKEKRQK